MKIKTDFITNSSSAAFIVKIDYLTCKQRTELDKMRVESTGWQIIDSYPVIFGTTVMDNFDMETYLKEAGFPMKKFQFFHSNDVTRNAVYLKSLETCDCEWHKIMRDSGL